MTCLVSKIKEEEKRTLNECLKIRMLINITTKTKIAIGKRDNSREDTRRKRGRAKKEKRVIEEAQGGGWNFYAGYAWFFKVHICVSRNQCGCLHANSSPVVLPLGHNYPEYMRRVHPHPVPPCHIMRKPRRRPSRRPRDRSKWKTVRPPINVTANSRNQPPNQRGLNSGEGKFFLLPARFWKLNLNGRETERERGRGRNCWRYIWEKIWAVLPLCLIKTGKGIDQVDATRTKFEIVPCFLISRSTRRFLLVWWILVLPWARRVLITRVSLMGTVVPAAVLNCVGIGRSMEIVLFPAFLIPLRDISRWRL